MSTQKFGSRTYSLPDGVVIVKQTIQREANGRFVIDVHPNGKHRERHIDPGLAQIPEIGIAVAEAHLGQLKEKR
jgi:hypothetical protein